MQNLIVGAQKKDVVDLIAMERELRFCKMHKNEKNYRQ